MPHPKTIPEGTERVPSLEVPLLASNILFPALFWVYKEAILNKKSYLHFSCSESQVIPQNELLGYPPCFSRPCGVHHGPVALLHRCLLQHPWSCLPICLQLGWLQSSSYLSLEVNILAELKGLALHRNSVNSLDRIG